MGENRVRFKADLEDKVSSSLDKIRDKFDQLGGKGSAASLFGNVGAKAVAKGFGLIDTAASAVIGVLGDAKQAYMEDQASQAKLDQSLRANVASYDGNKTAIEKVLTARMRLGFSDDEQRDSLASLVTRTRDASKALDLQRTAMDLARLRGIDLGSATDLLGKAFSGQVGALRRAGIAVAANATAEEALLAVKQAVSGQAEKYANTDAGKEVAASLRVGEAMEKIGEVVSKVAQVALPILADAFTFVIDVIGNVVGAFGAVGSAIEDLGQPLADLNDWVGSIPGPWQSASYGVSKATAEIVAAGVEAAKTPDALAADLRESKAIMQTASNTGLRDPLVGALTSARDTVIRVVTQTPADLAAAIRQKRSAWQSAVDLLASDLKNPLSRAAEYAKVVGELTGKNLESGLQSTDPVVRAQALATKAILETRLSELSEDAKGYGRNTGQEYADGLKSKTTTVETAAKGLARSVSRYLRVSSPAEAGPLSTLGGPGGWGERVGSLYGKGIEATLPNLSRALGGAPAIGGGSGSVLSGSGGAGPATSRSGLSGGGGNGFTIVGVSERDIMAMIDRGLYFRLQRAAPTSGRS